MVDGTDYERRLSQVGTRPDEAEGPDPDASSDVELLRIAREEAHRTIDSQVATLEDIDEKASRILRLNMLLLSVLVGAFSIATRRVDAGEPFPGAVVTALWNPFTAMGLAALLASTAVATVTYTASNVRTGMSGRDVARMVRNDVSGKRNLEGLVHSYARWMQYNFKVNTVNAPLGTATVLLLAYAIVLVAAGAYHALVQPVGVLGGLVLLSALAAMTLQTGIVGQLQRYWQYREFDPSQQ